jgi:hypothetical protein
MSFGEGEELILFLFFVNFRKKRFFFDSLDPANIEIGLGVLSI